MIKKDVIKFCFGLFFLLLFIQCVSSTKTNIQVKTVPFYEVQLTIIDSSNNVIERFRNYSDEYGDILFSFDTSKPVFNLILCLKKDGKTIKRPQKFLENYLTGTDLYFEFIPSGFQIIETPLPEPEINGTNETILPVVNETVSDDLEEKSTISLLSGYAILGSEKILKYKFYIFGFVAFIFLVFLVFKAKNFVKFERPKKEIRVKKLSELKKEKEESVQKSKELQEAEKRLKEVQREINSLKNKDKINNLKRKIVEEQQELMKLREGED